MPHGGGHPGIEEVVMTTNGLLLARDAQGLREAGVKRVNVSLDSLDPEKYAAIPGAASCPRCWMGSRRRSRRASPP